MKIKQQLKQSFVTWLAIYPVITVLLWQLGPQIGSYPLAVRTLILTVVMVPVMVFVLMPMLNSMLSKWLAPPDAVSR